MAHRVVHDPIADGGRAPVVSMLAVVSRGIFAASSMGLASFSLRARPASIGAFIADQFAARWLGEGAGMVLIDPNALEPDRRPCRA